jgi:hypothetical protein
MLLYLLVALCGCVSTKPVVTTLSDSVAAPARGLLGVLHIKRQKAKALPTPAYWPKKCKGCQITYTVGDNNTIACSSSTSTRPTKLPPTRARVALPARAKRN